MKKNITFILLIVLFHLTACSNFQPPYNNFDSPGFNQQKSPRDLIAALRSEDVQVIRDGQRLTLIIPTDKFFEFGTAQLNDLRYPALNNIAALVISTSDDRVYIAGFTDTMNSKESVNVKLSSERAKAMADFLWAKGFDIQRIYTKGYGRRYDIADNQLIHGSAMNRRLEIQWNAKDCGAID